MAYLPTFARRAKVHILDEVNCIITGLYPDDVLYFYNDYAVRTENYFYDPRYIADVWDGKLHFFEKDGKTFVYLLDKILPVIEKQGYKIELIDKRPPAKQLTEIVVTEDYFAAFTDPKTNGPWKMRPYQIEAANALLTHGTGIIIAGTGSGKTITNACLADVYGKQGMSTITVVPSESLITQTQNWFTFFNLDVGEYSGERKDVDHQHIVSTWQALQYMPEVLQYFDVIFIDECHGAQARVLREMLSTTGKHITYRFGLTGTLPKGNADVMNIRIMLGDVRHEIPAHTLIEQGWLAKLNISILQLDDKSHLDTFNTEHLNIDYDLEREFLRTYDPRNFWIVDFLKEKSLNEHGNVLCLVNSIAYGKMLAKKIPGCKFVHGPDKVKVRQIVYDLFETHDNLLVIATVQVAGVGISIDRIFNLIYIDGGKSFIRTIQAIGRGLRKGRDKEYVDVIDICSNLKYSNDHLNKRVKYYKEAKYPYQKYIANY